MEKTNLIGFINKYYLNGNVIKVIINSTEDNKLHCKFISDTKSVIGEMTMNNISFNKACSIGIYDSASFIKLLSALNDEFEVDIFEVDDEAKYITFKDDIKKAKYVLSHPDIIPGAPKEIKFPSFDIEIDVDEDFISNFIKSKNALVDANTFVFKEEKGALKVILNYDEANQSVNTIAFDVGDTKVELKDVIHFDANIFKEVLSVNRNDFDTGIIKVSSKGLMEIKFKSDDYEAIYYLVMLNK